MGLLATVKHRFAGFVLATGKAGPIDIRKGNLTDLDGVKDCACQAYARYVSRIGRKPVPMVADFKAQIEAGMLHVADVNGEAAGFIVLYPRRDHLHVENVAVFPARQGKGLGRALMRFAEEEAGRLGLAAIELYTNVKMTENQLLYTALGYLETDRRDEDGFVRIFYRKDL